jgi:hypothetical protein
MDAEQIERFRRTGGASSRRRVIQGLGVLGLGALSIVGITSRAEAATCKKQCPCRKHESNKKSRKRCKRMCP